MEDCKAEAEALAYKTVHTLPLTPEQVALQNFDRGRVAVFERIIEFKEELDSWIESLRG